MSQKPDQPTSTGGVQVFELTMDNPEDQDELNRRLRKPGEPESGSAPNNGQAGQAEPTAEAGRGRDFGSPGSNASEAAPAT